MTMKKKIITTLSVVLILGMAALGILAYLSDTADDVNVMTLGNVDITQHEYQRADGIAHNAGEAGQGNGVAKGALVPFEQNQGLYPAVPADNTAYTAEATDLFYWGEYVYSGTAGNGLWNDTNLPNVMDKMVFVENTGKSDCYYRTIIAFECPKGMEYSEGSDKEFMMNVNGSDLYSWNDIGYITVDGVRYLVKEATYQNALKPGNTAHPSLLQVVMTHNATNEDMELLGDTYEILVASQAVQVKGFADAQTALDTAFGEISASNHPWIDGVVVPDHFVGDLDGLKAAFAEGGNIKLTDDIAFEKITSIEPGVEVHLDMNGKTITVDKETKSNTLFYVKEGAKLTIDGNGTFDLGEVSTMAMFAPYGELVIENGTFIRDKVTTVTNKTTGLFMGAKSSGLNVTINGGYFDAGYYDTNAADIEEMLAGTKTLTETADDIAKRGNSKDANLVRVALKDNVSVLLNHSGYGSFKVYGGTFVGANPAWGDEGCMLPTTPNYLRPWSYYQGALLDGQTFNENGVVLPDGYTITKSLNSDGIPVYTVNYSK